ncbi:MAG: bifunctional adenosylcobinamide kinase/adenosylcobinamide-phosphate guanylyltransferase [Deltaproteobacteria bacterium]|nr:bifunctional adenosylcobinamide kinase/adenosylcobinamide-phosphate guanylyltransferase [Deltaproteobacteria bacterium]
MLEGNNQGERRILVTGGCRSGKSRFALDWAAARGARKIFVATASVIGDPEMARRVERHRRERGLGWNTVEEPRNPARVLRSICTMGDVAVIDCLTLWVSNLLVEDTRPADVVRAAEDLARALEAVTCPVALVANEVGMGIVPENELGRTFRDLAGEVNQIVARTVDRVVFMVAGLPMDVRRSG